MSIGGPGPLLVPALGESKTLLETEPAAEQSPRGGQAFIRGG